MTNRIKQWMAQATTRQQLRLAAFAKSSRGMLYQLASGQRKASPELAARLEIAFNKMYGKPDERLTRADISETCARCPFAKKCLELEKE